MCQKPAGLEKEKRERWRIDKDINILQSDLLFFFLEIYQSEETEKHRKRVARTDGYIRSLVGQAISDIKVQIFSLE